METRARRKQLFGFSVLLCGVRCVEEEAEWYNGLCFATGDKTPEQCCVDRDPTCWDEDDMDEEFCCHPLPEHIKQCYADMELRATQKQHMLEWARDEHMKTFLEIGVGIDEMTEDEMARMVDLTAAIDGYTQMTLQPQRLYSWACQYPVHPILWSSECECCEPAVAAADCNGLLEAIDVAALRARCCYPVLTRRHGLGVGAKEELDEELEASIQRHLGSLQVKRGGAHQVGPTLHWPLGNGKAANGCLVVISHAGPIHVCEEAVACVNFDCSYLRAFLATLAIIHHVRRLPPMELVFNAADLVLPEPTNQAFPVFTRTGTKWTNTVALPFEWQLHPFQCQKHIREITWSAARHPWEGRKAKLIWRGTASNCYFEGCRVGDAEGNNSYMERCVGPFSARRCKEWDLPTWLRMPRGRLVWATRMFPRGIDARMVASEHLHIHPPLVDFLTSEGLLAERMDVLAQMGFKYSIAIEGDSAPDRLYWQLFSGSVTLLPDGPWQVYAVTDLLKPFVHYVPVRYDLSDLIEKVVWLQEHDDEAHRIALNAAAFARRYVKCEATVYFVDRLLRAYAERLVPD